MWHRQVLDLVLAVRPCFGLGFRVGLGLGLELDFRVMVSVRMTGMKE